MGAPGRLVAFVQPPSCRCRRHINPVEGAPATPPFTLPRGEHDFVIYLWLAPFIWRVSLLMLLKEEIRWQLVPLRVFWRVN